MNNISDTIDSIKSTALAKNVYIAVAESVQELHAPAIAVDATLPGIQRDAR